jgi:lysozyme
METGIDVSSYQGTINWHAVAASGLAFAFAKATEGTGFVDAQFATNWSAMREFGLYRGAYHFGRPGQDPETQAVHFHSVVGETGFGDLPPVLDIEASDGHPAAAVLAWVLAFVKKAEALFGRKLVIYTGGFWRFTLGNPVVAELKDNPLWLAQYSQGTPTAPSTWAKWTFWQYTDGSFGSPPPVPGIAGPCDRDRFAGDKTELAALAGTGASPPPPVAQPTSWPGRYFVWPSQPVVAGEDVRTWQNRMVAIGFALTADGVYGPESKRVCAAFQRDRGMNADGIVGAKTWAASFAA